MANDDLQLGRQTVDAGSCADPQRSIAQIQSVIEAMGNPGPIVDPSGDTYSVVYATTINGDTVLVTPDGTGGGTTVSIPGPNIITGQATSSVATIHSDFDIDNIDLITGVDPRTDTGSSTETVEIKNTFSDVFANNDLVMAVQRDANGLWEVIHQFDDNTGSGGGSYTAGDGINIASSVISVDEGDGLALTAGKVVVELAADSGLEFNAGDLQDKWRYHVARGTLSANAHPNAGDVTLNTAVSVWGEDPPTTITPGLPGTQKIYADSGDTIYAVANSDEGVGDASNWSLATALNFMPLLKGVGGYDHAVDQWLVSAAGTLDWRDPEEALELIDGHVASGVVQVIINNNGTIAWGTAVEVDVITDIAVTVSLNGSNELEVTITPTKKTLKVLESASASGADVSDTLATTAC